VGGREWRAAVVIDTFISTIIGSEGGATYDHLKRGGELLGGTVGGSMVWEKEGAVSMARRRERRRRRRSAARCGRKKGWVGRVGLKAEQASGWLGRLGRNLKKDSFQNKIWIFEYTKALDICTRRFRRNFDMGIFPKFF
jgi:hypothetical protein